jgi:RNA methyltransferase, TrmH family
MIESSHNPRIKQVRALLSQHKERVKQSAFVAEGVRLVEDAVLAGWLPEWALYSSQISARGMQIVEGLASGNIPVEEISPDLMTAISATETPQGLLAIFAQRVLPFPLELDFLLILDNLRDPGNLGTILRTARAAGVQSVILTPGTVDAFSPKVLRSGMGAHFHTPIQSLAWPEIEALCKTNLQNHLKIFIAEAAGEKSIWQADLRQPLALIIGGEAEGPSLQARQIADETLTIPMPGKSESLNAAISSGIILFEIIRQRQK